MSDKHEAKQKAMRAKSHIGVPEHHAEHQDHSHLHDPGFERQSKESGGNVQDESADARAEGDRTQD